ncbi:ArnT family glycosyltransferase [Tundrisphaera sp. TA3]|uniref:ArnT family glycosyltransferase n=1 Tax=Tundrisphaera sp. TA3 TaxID=3435775 RepID=UPI003EBBF167
MTPRDSTVDAPAGMAWRRLACEAALVAGLALTLNLVGNGRVGLWDRDEPRYATCTREMRERGDWIYPTFNDQPRFHKPVLIYWLMRAGYAVGGDNPFGARLVSSIAGAMTCVVVLGLGRSMVGPRAGLLAALALATAPIMIAESKLATTDATLALFLVSAQACLWGLSRADRPGLAAGFWALMAGATLLKGPVGPALVSASGLMSWWWGGPTACWRRLRWKRGLLGFLVLTLPWFVAVGLASRGEFFRFAIGSQIVQRVTTGMEQHGAFPGYYPLVTLPTFYPWSAFLPVAAYAAWTRRRNAPEAGFLLGWIVGPLIVLECCKTKLIHYFLPSIPACALLVAWILVEASRRNLAIDAYRFGRAGIKLLGAMGIGATAAFLVGPFFLPSEMRWPCLAIALTLGVGTYAARMMLARGETTAATHGLVATWALTMGMVGGWLIPSAEPFRLSRVVGEKLGTLSAQTGVRPAIMTFQEPGIIYALGRPAADIESPEDLREQVRRDGAVLLPLLPDEVAELRKDPALDIEVAEQLVGFNANKGKTQALEFSIIRARKVSAVAAAPEQSLVK